MAVRIRVDEPYLADDIHYIEAACLSTDTKPSGVATGSLCLEVNTGDVYAYDETGAQWKKICALGGSGS